MLGNVMVGRGLQFDLIGRGVAAWPFLFYSDGIRIRFNLFVPTITIGIVSQSLHSAVTIIQLGRTVSILSVLLPAQDQWRVGDAWEGVQARDGHTVRVSR